MDPAADGIRELLSRLKQRLVSGDIDRREFEAQRELILADLTPEQRARLGVTTPRPAEHVGSTAGTPRLGPLGPSGGAGAGMGTSLGGESRLQLEPGTVLLGQWRIERELGRGGFGAVFEAEELSLQERHAVKVLDPELVAREETLSRFRREVSVMRKVIHPRIVRVFDYREDLARNLALISMELVEGGSVRSLLASARGRSLKVPLTLALAILRETLEALEAAHSRGVIHRDVTPGNVLLECRPEELLADSGLDPRVRLVDFGIAGLVDRSAISEKSRVLGTAAYVAPEVFDSTAPITKAADVYGAGAVVYELLTGDLPLGRYAAPRELRPEIPETIDGLLVAMLERSATARPSASEALELLRSGSRVPTGPADSDSRSNTLLEVPPRDPEPSAVEPLPLPTPRPWPGLDPEARPQPNRRPWAIASFSVLALVALFVAYRFWLSKGEVRPAPDSPVPAVTAVATPADLAPTATEGTKVATPQEHALSAEKEAAERERRERARRERYVDADAAVAATPAAIAVGSSGGVDRELSAALARAVGASMDLFRPAFVQDGLFRRAADGDRGVLKELGLGTYPGTILLVVEEVKVAPDSLARDLSVANVRLSGRVYIGGRGIPVQGEGRVGDFNRDRAIERARTAAREQLLNGVSQAGGN